MKLWKRTFYTPDYVFRLPSRVDPRGKAEVGHWLRLLCRRLGIVKR